MGRKVPALSPTPSKDPNHCSSLPPGCHRQRAARRAKKEPREGAQTQRGVSRLSTRMPRDRLPRLRSWVAGQGGGQVLRQVSRPTMEVVRVPGAVLRSVLAAETEAVRHREGLTLAQLPRLLCPVPPVGRRPPGPRPAALRRRHALDHDLEDAGRGAIALKR